MWHFGHSVLSKLCKSSANWNISHFGSIMWSHSSVANILANGANDWWYSGPGGTPTTTAKCNSSSPQHHVTATVRIHNRNRSFPAKTDEQPGTAIHGMPLCRTLLFSATYPMAVLGRKRIINPIPEPEHEPDSGWACRASKPAVCKPTPPKGHGSGLNAIYPMAVLGCKRM
jgi:hypothetical protein